ncbi:hypothetical protein VFPPC_01184 [Pochonia chlamydosporia 170]|uniref:Uncharacterized protein n=1 Tax=Pochonia chlamydosporia 170 TaxID=1380566 RepID=A0A179G6S0_METCM|nr:hypothetical protein VFPPC_01184 [Pochonia chlamydosporia 170]OAQ73486.1 hypothetical protein VFPPC_01184 [Pochonia chlamydosporia 170]
MASNTSEIDMNNGDVAHTHARYFRINRRNFSGHYDVEEMDGTHLFYVDMWSLGSGKPDLTLHQGPDNKSPIVAVSHMPTLGSDYKIGIGDPNEPNSMQWDDLAKERLTQSGWRWIKTLTDGERAGSTLNLMWKRTKKVTVDGMTVQSMSSRNYKLQDSDTGSILAVFTGDRTYRRCGVLQLNVSYGRPFDLSVFTTCLTLYEEARRESHQSGGGG